MSRVVYFATPAKLREWFRKHHATASELHLGYFKIGSGTRSVTWPESVDEALCVGWIDGKRQSLGAERYTIRFSARKPGSIWSTKNIKRVAELTAEGRMLAEGVRAFDARRENRSGVYSYEQRREDLDEPYASVLKKNRAAATFFEAQPPSYRRAVFWWIASAKREETRLRRLGQLIAISSRRQRIPQFTPLARPR